MSAPKYSFDKVLVLSTAHLAQKTCEAIRSDDFPLYAAKTEHGGFVWVDDVESAIFEGFEDLEAPMRLAKRLGCNWLRFDCDACTIDELPQHEWS